MQVKTQWPLKSCRIALVGEAPGEEEERVGTPFIGPSGMELTKMLGEAGIVREDCLVTNVFSERPPKNDLSKWGLKKKEADDAWFSLGNQGKYPFLPVKAGCYIDPRRLGELRRLYSELIEFNPTVIVALGNTALWALCCETGITKVRGTIVDGEIGGERPFKILPTFHPSYIMRNWDERIICVADLLKAKRESANETYVRPVRELWLEPTLEEIREFMYYLSDVDAFTVDIETARGQITCIGFGTRKKSLCIPFLDERKSDWNYWPDAQSECFAWECVRQILELKVPTKIFQNGMYDIQWLWRQMGLAPKGETHDTMLLQHSMFPEMRKSLGFLGSIYTNESAWKRMRPKRKHTRKREDAET